MKRYLAIILAAGVLSGCRSNPRKDLVEAELRVKDRDMREMREELERTGAYNQHLQRELRNIQQSYPGSAPVEALSAAQVKSIALGRQTSGIDDDNVPGDEGLQVVIEPRDGDNHTLKVAGTVNIQALEVTSEGTKRPISAWHVDPETLRKSWRSGLLSTGYYLVLPWRCSPSSTKIRVVTQFITQDNRLFEADKDVVVRLMPMGMRKSLPPEEGVLPVPTLPPTPTLPAPSEGPTLPAPKEADPIKPQVMEKVEKKEEESPLGPLGLPPGVETATTEPEKPRDPQRPLKGAVELLKPIVPGD